MTSPPAAGRARRLMPVLAPVLAGAAGGIALEITVPPRYELFVAAAPGLVVAVAGLVAAGCVLAVRRVGWRMSQARDGARQQAAAQYQQERLRFLMRLDHELKNPLTAIRAGLANVEAAVPASAGDALASVAAQAERIARLAGDLRKLAELETRPVETAPVDLPGLLHEVAGAMADVPGAGERSIRVSVPQAPWPLPLVEGDRDLLFIALQNLVANSVKFSAPGDAVEVRAADDGDAVLIEVADTGAGIPGDEIGEVWQELARGRSARALPGTGIGLALVRVIVARHGGRVAIRSRDGQGTVVSVRLPVPARTETAPHVPDLRQ